MMERRFLEKEPIKRPKKSDKWPDSYREMLRRKIQQKLQILYEDNIHGLNQMARMEQEEENPTTAINCQNGQNGYHHILRGGIGNAPSMEAKIIPDNIAAQLQVSLFPPSAMQRSFLSRLKRFITSFLCPSFLAKNHSYASIAEKK